MRATRRCATAIRRRARCSQFDFENIFNHGHAGDTGVFSDMKMVGDIHKPDLLLRPIGGGQFVTNPVDAANAARDLIKPKAVIPMHYGTNPSLVGTPAEFSKALGASAIKVLAISPGESLEF